MNNSKKIGNIGEEIARQFLIRKKYRILEMNHKEGFYEIDLIGKSFDGVLVFVEVKTMKAISNSNFEILPEEHMTSDKFRKVKNGCLMFIAKHRKLIHPKKGWRIDLIAIFYENKDIFKINHYENIFC